MKDTAAFVQKSTKNGGLNVVKAIESNIPIVILYYTFVFQYSFRSVRSRSIKPMLLDPLWVKNHNTIQKKLKPDVYENMKI